MGNPSNMAKSTPAREPPTLKTQTSSSSSQKNQSSILGFFSKSATNGTSSKKSSNTQIGTSGPLVKGSANLPSRSPASGKAVQKNGLPTKRPAMRRPLEQNVTPVPSSDVLEAQSDEDDSVLKSSKAVNGDAATSFSSPSRRAKKIVSYAESDNDNDIPVSRQRSMRNGRNQHTVRPIVQSDSDAFEEDTRQAVDELSDDDMDDFVVSDDSDTPRTSSKRKRAATQSTTSRKRFTASPPDRTINDEQETSAPQPSTVQQWKFDPDNKQTPQPRYTSVVKASKSTTKTSKPKAHTTEPSQRYPWLANIADIDRNPPGHPEYDPRTVYIPPGAWNLFSAFEKQYWEIKQKWWDTIVFFKKGKFYELYENDATIGHQLFDLKLTDRVNMRMVGVPESSLETWSNQFVAKGYKIAIVTQCESALGKEMRERDDGKPKKLEKVIRRELSTVLTNGTLVEGSMLQDDMSTYCLAIKESIEDDLPVFGIAFIDAATGKFFVSEFVDDLDLTKFETLVAQIRPSELLLEKSHVSVKALRILKSNTSPTTAWNYLKPTTEFWSADQTCRELEHGGYFSSEESNGASNWPETLVQAKDKDYVMSALGALVQYLTTLMLERDLLTQGNFTWYDPIRKATTLVLDGQTLINLEIFANTFDGGSTGTLFTLLNRCITPFGKRLFRQWLCHPLADADRINERLDAVDMLNTDSNIREQFTSQMTKMPDLERLISRIHAGVCRPENFVRVLDGFEQIEYTMNLLSAFSGGDGLIDRLLLGMPDLKTPLVYWKTAFDRVKAKDDNMFIPAPEIEDDYDTSHDRISELEEEFKSLLKAKQKEFGSSAIQYKDVGKEIYQLEVPLKVKNIPRDWDHVSAAKNVKRYYFPKLRSLVREYQEAQERHAQIVKEVAGRFFARFDQDSATWVAAIKIIAQLDCLISLATASSSLGEPSCRPTFVDTERSVLDFEELRHPCMLPHVADFIPNDVKLGGDNANISLLTGANAAGKSTILRMTCVAVIMAQIGCHVPGSAARLTPVDRIMSRLGANDNIFAAQSTFFVELSETKKMLSEATPRSLVILDELGRGTSSYDGVAVAQAVLHHVATHVGCTGFFATHYHSLAAEFAGHPEVAAARMRIAVDAAARRVTFLYRLEPGVAEGSFGMHCAAMCGIPERVVARAEVAAREWEHTSRLRESLERARSACYVPLGVQSDVAWLLRGAPAVAENEGAAEGSLERGLEALLQAVASL